MKEKWRKLTLVSFTISGLCFSIFPLLRPYFNESQVVDTGGFTSAFWIISHTFGMGGLLFLSFGILGVYSLLAQSKSESPAWWALLFVWIGTGFTLPFYGAETFSLPVIANAAISQNSPSLLHLINAVRFGPGLAFIAIGLTLIAIAAILLSRVIWVSKLVPKWSGLPLAIGFADFTRRS